jgi:ABC-2 type transport system ATP-binding protein
MVRVSELSKYYAGTRALGPVSFEIPSGQTVGFLGLNGAGKTTLLRVLACALRPSAGSVTVGGFDALQNPHAVRQRVGFLPQEPPLYVDMTVGGYLAFVGRLRGLDPAEVRARVPEVEERTNLEEADGELIRHLSHGYRQRVGVAQAVIHDPDLLILDEPTHALDPVQVVEMRSMIQGLKADHTILISSHILPEISETCDRLMILNEGAIIATGTEEELSSRLLESRRFSVTVKPRVDGEKGLAKAGKIEESVSAEALGVEEEPLDSDACEAVVACIRRIDGIRAVEATTPGEAGAVSFLVDASGDRRAEVVRALVEAGHGVLRVERTRRELESVFLELVQERQARDASG